MSQVLEKPFDLATHNGFITVLNPASGEHRTFRVRRRPDDSKFAPGKRTVGLLTGSDNESDYRDFGFVGDDGRIWLWKKHRGQKAYEWFARCLSNPERFTHLVEFNFEERCRRCNRQLSTPESCARGIGPDCAEKEGL